MHERDEQISRLKERLKILSVRLHDTKDKEVKLPKDKEARAKATIEQGNELQNIIRQVEQCTTLLGV